MVLPVRLSQCSSFELLADPLLLPAEWHSTNKGPISLAEDGRSRLTLSTDRVLRIRSMDVVFVPIML